jgi:hypothetical protein
LRRAHIPGNRRYLDPNRLRSFDRQRSLLDLWNAVHDCEDAGVNVDESGADEASARSLIAESLRRDAEAQLAGRFDEVGLRCDDVEAAILSERPVTPAVALAFEFWYGWIDSRNHDWRFYPGIERDDWPRCAEEIAAALTSGDEITNPTILLLFTPQPQRSFRELLGDLFDRPFPTRSEASANLRRGLGALRRPWVIAVLIATWTFVIALTQGMSDNTIPLTAAAVFTATLLYNVGSPPST